MRPSSSEHSIQCPVNYEVPRVASGNMHDSWPCASTCDTLSDFWARLSWLWVVSPHTLTQPLSPEDWEVCRSLMASALLSPHWASACGLPDAAAETWSPSTELVFLSQSLCLLLPDAQVWKIVISYILSYFFLVSDVCVCEQLWFWNNFGLRRNCKDSSENIYTAHSVTSNVNLLNYCGTLVQTKTIMSIHASLLTPETEYPTLDSCLSETVWHITFVMF